MDVSTYKFGDDEIERLHYYRDNQPDARLKLRFIAFWYHQYVTRGIDSLNSFQYQPKKSFLTPEQIDQVAKWVKETNPGKIKEVREYIKDHFQISYSNEAVRKMLQKVGLKVLRPKVVPGDPPSEEEQKKTSKNI